MFGGPYGLSSTDSESADVAVSNVGVNRGGDRANAQELSGEFFARISCMTHVQNMFMSVGYA